MKGLVAIVAGGIMLMVAGIMVGVWWATPRHPPTDLGPTLARLERREKWAEEREKAYTKCIAVEKMDLTIYPVPNVGVRKVTR